MKKILHLSLSFLTTIVFGQVTYLSTDFANVGYSQFVSSSLNDADYNFVETGANFSWNYNGLSAINQENVGFINPNDTGYKTNWCLLNGYLFNCNSQFDQNFNLATELGSNLGIEGLPIDNIFSHLRKTSSNLQNRMIGVEFDNNGTLVKIPLSYTNPDTIYEFPFTYNSANTSNSLLNFDATALGFPVNINITQTRVNLVEGWGSLTTPFGTFAQVLKMKTTINGVATIVNDGETTTTSFSSIEYKWFDKAHGIPVLEVSGPVVDGNWTAATIRYIDNELSTNTQNLDRVVIYPNPTNGELFINLSKEQIKNISVVNLLGQEVGQSLDLSHLNTGFYIVNIETDMGKISKKIFKQ